MSLFLSTYVNKVDKKGRVSVPAQFRTVLVNERFPGIIAYPSFVHDCVEACGISRIERLSESIDNLDPFSEQRDAFATSILGGSLQIAFDSEGRISLPESLIEVAALKEQAVFVGKGATFEIWEPKRFDAYSEKARTLAKQERAVLRLSPKTGGPS
ncbi:MAG: transcriptional regulator MraZ [Proteobacteria bacterium]|nr:transcriptional regulator MraZ [Pseudomonadota bacterium]